MTDSTADVAALKATVRAQSIEIRDLKSALAEATKSNADSVTALGEKLEALTLAMQPLLLAGPRLEQLLLEAEQQKGMERLGKAVAGTGFLALLGSAVLGIYHYFAKGGLH